MPKSQLVQGGQRSPSVLEETAPDSRPRQPSQAARPELLPSPEARANLSESVPLHCGQGDPESGQSPPSPSPETASASDSNQCYLLHYEQALGQGKHGCAQHYLGSTRNLSQRLTQHRRPSDSAHLCAAFARAGIGFELVRTWQGAGNLEAWLKAKHNSPKLCPYCNPEGWQRYGSQRDGVALVTQAHHSSGLLGAEP